MILPLGSFDVILGMDCLEEHSPDIDWVDKHITIRTEGQLACLQGHHLFNIPCATVSATQLEHMCTIEEIDHMVFVCVSPTSQLQEDSVMIVEGTIPDIVQDILDQFTELFAEPTTLPPRHYCDHHIPLLPGDQPISIRLYRHAPATKDEIEKQVAELLHSGIIQRSTSPFASPVILVKKKDGQ